MESDVIFDDGTVEDNIDVIIFATGYSFSFPFLEGLIAVTDNEVSLYKFMFPPDLERPTLAVIGLIQPLGIILPIAELQSRWAVRVFKGLWTKAGRGLARSPKVNPPCSLHYYPPSEKTCPLLLLLNIVVFSYIVSPDCGFPSLYFSKFLPASTPLQIHLLSVSIRKQTGF